MQDVVRQSGSFSEKFIVCSVAKVVEGRQVRRAVAMTELMRWYDIDMILPIQHTQYSGTQVRRHHAHAVWSPSDSVCVTKTLKFMVTM